MSDTPEEMVRRVLSDPANLAVVNELVAEDSVYVSTAGSSRSGGTGTISSDPDGHAIEV
jgi:hypothetical protein